MPEKIAPTDWAPVGRTAWQIRENQQNRNNQHDRKSQKSRNRRASGYLHLPAFGPPQEFDLIADELDTQRRRRNGKQVEKIRHFEPLAVALGLEQIEDLDDGELEDCLAESAPPAAHNRWY